MELKVTKDTFAFKIEQNPFRKLVTESGIYLGDGSLYNSDDTGQMEQLNQAILFGVVTITGPECKTVKVGDGIYFDARSAVPIPFYEPVWVLHEGSIRSYVPDDGTLQQMIDDFKEEARVAAFKDGLAMNTPLGATSQVAGTAGSGLSIVR